MIASESVAIEASGFTFESDLQPGEALVYEVGLSASTGVSSARRGRTLPVCSSSSTWRAQTRSWTVSRCTRVACVWEIIWRLRSCASDPTTKSTS